ncbi:MAG: decaprenylphospho-beta-D-erythro-pentofuranosid-2-ulose 2-reductase [Micromonosporaceae bacterium]|nr:decaprenylphospho-beta-D-erythro-pentofuranosid-2-ulose 2-reductase [Micromonosporaceae bacterium]
MIDGLGAPQSLLLLGGTSDIAVAIAERYLAKRPLRVVLAGRPSAQLEAVAGRLADRGAAVETVAFDAAKTAEHEEVLGRVFAGGDIDIAVVAFGVLGDQAEAERDPTVAVSMAQVNYVGAVSAGVCLAKAMRRQGHGTIVALSSMAAERPRRSNFMYGSTKAGLDAFFSGLADALVGSGVRAVVVRPGQVRTKMTAHLPDAPMTTTPEAVAASVVSAVSRGRHTVWVPGRMRAVSSVLRHLPRPVFRRLPF